MIAIVPARGGSKGLPGKNIRILHGKPLIAYTIEAALKSPHIEEVFLSTDSQEIANIGMQYGVTVPFLRPAKLATDDALAIDNYIYTIERLEKISNKEISSVMILQPTSPLRNFQDIGLAIDLFNRNNADSVISYTEEELQISWHKYISTDGHLIDILESSIKNRQAYRESYYPNGAIYIFKKELLLQGKYYNDNTFAYIMPRNRSVDIDTLDDFIYAEYLLGNIDAEHK